MGLFSRTPVSVLWALCLFPNFLLSAFCQADPCDVGYAKLAGIRSGAETRVLELIAARKAKVLYADVPSVAALHLPAAKPYTMQEATKLSAGITDPLLERARELKAFEDFKPLADARPKALTAVERAKIERESRASSLGDEKLFLRRYIARAYEFDSELRSAKSLARPLWRLESGDPAKDDAFRYTEELWGRLLRRTEAKAGGSLLDVPYPMLVPGGRFTETYYWDTYFGIRGLLATGRIELAQMQTENLLSFVRRYGFVPNGNRDYYLTRSQPPFLSSAVREVFEATMKSAKNDIEKKRALTWLKERAYPLVKRDYENFWMNPRTRFDEKTGLNHHWDDANLPRPERHAFDSEEKIGKSYRDVRAAAESGLDFTAAHQGEASKVAPVLLNSLLYKTEQDLAWMARYVGDGAGANYTRAAGNRATAMRRLLWNEKEGRFEGFHLRTGQRVPALTAETFAPLYVGMASPDEAARVRNLSLPKLERRAGIMASTLDSPHQWDGDNGWAPQQMLAVAGLKNYHFDGDAHRLAKKWVDAIAEIHQRDKTIYERINVTTGAKPVRDEVKYPTQEGFLWTNSSYVWMLLDVLGAKKRPL